MARPRKFSPSEFGLTEEQYQAMDEDRRRHFRNRAYYLRNKKIILARIRKRLKELDRK